MRFLSQISRCLVALALLLSPSLPGAHARHRDREWRVYGGDPGSTRYSPLDQINRSNVHRLKVA